MTDNAISGLIELSDRGVIRVAGPESRDFLQGLITNNIEKVSESSTIYAALLTPQGKFLFDFFISEIGGALYLDVRKETLSDLLKRLTMYKLRADVTLEDVSDDFTCGAVIGETASRLAEAIPEDAAGVFKLDGGITYIDPRLSEMGFRLLLPNDEKASILQKLDLPSLPEQAYVEHRLNIGVPEGGVDIISDKAFLLESNFDELNGVDHHKGCYIGQETTSRTKRKGTIRKRLLPITFEGTPPNPGEEIKAGDAVIGPVFSGLGNRAMALIRTDRLAKATTEGTALLVGEKQVEVHVPSWLSLEETDLQ